MGWSICKGLEYLSQAENAAGHPGARFWPRIESAHATVQPWSAILST